MAAIQILASIMPLDLQVEKEFLHTRAFRMNSDLEIDHVSISAVDIQRKAERWKVHLAKAPSINFEDAPSPLEDSSIHQGVYVFMDESKTAEGVGSGIAIFFFGGDLVEGLSYGL